MFNAGTDGAVFGIPVPPAGERWCVAADTWHETPQGVVGAGSGPFLDSAQPYQWGHVPAHCSFVLRALQSARMLARLLQVDEPVQRALADEESGIQQLSPRWRYAVIVTFALGFGVLILLTFKAYQNAPPIPERVVDTAGAVVFTGDDVRNGQEVFLKYGLMDNGTIWGHGGYLGPDFGAAVLHDWALALAQQRAQARYSKEYAVLSGEERAVVDAEVAHLLKINRYDPQTGTLTVLPAGLEVFQAKSLAGRTISAIPTATAACRRISSPIRSNFTTSRPSLRGRRGRPSPSGRARTTPIPTISPMTRWPGITHRARPSCGPRSASSFCSAARRSCCWRSANSTIWAGTARRRRVAAWVLSGSQKAALKYMAVAAILLLGQTVFGAGIAHYRADPGTFYGIDLSRFFPSNLLRTWHLQSAIFWIATSYVAGALFVAELLGRDEPAAASARHPSALRCGRARHRRQHARRMGRPAPMAAAQLVLVRQSGLGISGDSAGSGRFCSRSVCCSGSSSSGARWRRRGAIRERRGFANFFLIAAFAIPLFYLPALFFGSQTNYTIVDAWRFWIIHLWVEGFFEFFVTVIVAVIFYEMGLVQRHHGAAHDLSGCHPLFRRRPHRHRPPLVLDRADGAEYGVLRPRSPRSKSYR